MKDIWGKILQTGGARIYALLVSMFTLILTTRLMGPDGVGVLAAITSWVGLFSTMASFSLGQVAIHKASQNQKKPNEWFPPVFGSLLVLMLVLTVFSVIVAVVLHYFISSLFGGISMITFGFGFLLVPLLIWEQYSGNLLLAIDKLKIYNRAQVIGRTFSLVLVVIFVGFLNYGVNGVIFSNIVGQLIVSLAGFKVLWVLSGRKLILDIKQMFSLLKGGSKLHLNSVGTFLFSQSSILILNVYASKAEVGWYQLSLQLMSIMLIIPQSGSMVLYSRVVNEGVANVWPKQKKLGIQIMFIMIFSCVVAYIVAPWSIPLVAGKDFEESVNAFRYLLPSLLGMTFSTIMASQWIGQGLFWQASLLSVGCAIINVFLNFWLVPHYGVYGAVISTNVVYFIIVFICNLLMAIRCERIWLKSRDKYLSVLR